MHQRKILELGRASWKAHADGNRKSKHWTSWWVETMYNEVRSSLNCYSEQFKPDSKVNVWFYLVLKQLWWATSWTRCCTTWTRVCYRFLRCLEMLRSDKCKKALEKIDRTIPKIKRHITLMLSIPGSRVICYKVCQPSNIICMSRTSECKVN